jgi:hypothetical protein
VFEQSREELGSLAFDQDFGALGAENPDIFDITTEAERERQVRQSVLDQAPPEVEAKDVDVNIQDGQVETSLSVSAQEDIRESRQETRREQLRRDVAHQAGEGIDPSDISDGDTLSVAPADIAGTALEADGTNLAVSSGGIGSTELASGAVTSTELSDGTISTADIGQNGASDGHVLRWDGSAWETGFPGTTGSLAVFELEAGGETLVQLDPNDTSDPNVVIGTGHTVSSRGVTVGGGVDNEASEEAATVGGGAFNEASGQNATVAGGTGNTASDQRTAVAGGSGNTASAQQAAVGGGFGNTASDQNATVGGGQSNTAGGLLATVPGGARGAAEDDRSFVWSDGTGYHAIPNTGNDGLSSSTAVDDEPVTGTRTFSVSALDGVRFITGTPGSPNVTYIESGGTLVPGGNAVGAPAGTGLALETDDGSRALRLGVPTGDGNGNTAGGNVLAGSPNNSIDGAVGAVVAGGGSDSAANSVSDNYATVSGGQSNTAEGISSTVGGGDSNTAGFTGATVGGGENNTASTTDATVGGGTGNTAGGLGSAPAATVGGGENNTAEGPHATVGGGENNTAGGISATVAGGLNNTAGKFTATVGGGQSNTASKDFGTVPGGGFGAAEETRTFVWNDGTGYHAIPNTSSDGLSSNTAVDGEPVTGPNTFSVSATGGVRFVTGDASNPNVTYIPSDSAGWTTTSSRAVKTNIDPIEPREALAGVEELEVATWEYETEDESGAATTHIGPMAEEFHDAFDVGSSDEHINSINADGVALAAIQGLSAELDDTREELDEKDDRIAELEAENERLQDANEQLREQNAELEQRLAAVEDHLGLGDSGTTAGGVADD